MNKQNGVLWGSEGKGYSTLGFVIVYIGVLNILQRNVGSNSSLLSPTWSRWVDVKLFQTPAFIPRRGGEKRQQCLLSSDRCSHSAVSADNPQDMLSATIAADTAGQSQFHNPAWFCHCQASSLLLISMSFLSHHVLLGLLLLSRELWVTEGLRVHHWSQEYGGVSFPQQLLLTSSSTIT